MIQHRDPSVLVGVDGTPAGSVAVRLAATEAAFRHMPLDLVAGFRPEPDEVRRAVEWTPRDVARRWLIEATALAKSAVPHLPIRTELLAGDLADVLIVRSRHADLVVVAEGEVPAVSRRVAAHAAAPVVVARCGHLPGGPVLLGVDGARAAGEVVDFAFAEAAVRGTPLVAVHVWCGVPKAALSGVDPFAYDLATARGDADRMLAEGLAGWAEKYPDVPVERRSPLAPDIGGELVRQSAKASMLVVGARSHLGASELLLGSVTRFVLQHAACPVAVLNPAPLRVTP